MRWQTDSVVIATRNPGKVKEFAKMFGKLGFNVKSLNEMSGVPEIVEDGTSFSENARKKAFTIAHALNLPTLADDSGLCVDRLGGEPGVRSARYAGENATDSENNLKLIRELKKQAGTEPGPYLSPARFVCALVLYDPASGKTFEAEGACEGLILDHPRGEGGFGYDPLFYLPDLGKTMAELSVEEKNGISHRAKAMGKLLALLAETI